MNRIRLSQAALAALALATLGGSALADSTTVTAQPAAATDATPPVDAKPRLSIDPSAITFDGSGEKTVTISNKGNAPLEIYEVRLNIEGKPTPAMLRDGQKAPEDPYKWGAGGAPTAKQLKPGESLKVAVKYDPPKGSKQAYGSLEVVCNDSSLRGMPEAYNPKTDSYGAWGAGIPLKAGDSNLLLYMVFCPLLGALLCLFVPKGKETWCRYIALAAAAVPMGLAVWLFMHYDRNFGLANGNHGLQYVKHFVWIERFNVEFFMGVDGISVTMVILTALVSLIAVGSSWSITKQVRGYFIMFLLLETGMMGTFASLDFFLFYIFWELMLLPMYFLIGIWGGPRKEYATIKFFLYTLAGSVLLLIAIIALYYTSGKTGILHDTHSMALVNGAPSAHTFNIMKLTYLNNFWAADPLLFGWRFSYVVWIGIFIGFAIKVPMFPFHTWLPDAHVEAPTAISVILAGVLLKMGTYGMFRMNFAILPEATHWARSAIAIFGVINILYGAFCAMAQTDLKKLVAYSSVSHMGYCLLGMAALTEQGMAGSLMQMWTHGTITAMLFLLVGVIYDRTHTRGVNEFGGVASVMPRYAALFGFAFMASLGLPGLSGFIAEFLVFVGSFNIYKIMTILAALGVIVTAAYHLWALQRIHLGTFNPKWEKELRGNDLTGREMVMLLPLAAIVLFLGFYPMPALDMMSTGVKDLAHYVESASVAAKGTAIALGVH